MCIPITIMLNATLSSHSIRVIRNSSSKSKDPKFEILENIGLVEGSNISLFSLFQDYMKNNLNKINTVKSSANKIWFLSKYQISEDKTKICGTIKYGEGGTREELFNIETKEKDYEKTPNQAGLMKYYFLLYIPNNSDIGYLIIQRIQNRGIKVIFSEICKDIEKSKITKYAIWIENIFSKEYFERIQKQWFPKEIRITAVTKPNLSGDIADYRSEKPSKKIQATTKIEYLLKYRFPENKRLFDKIINVILRREQIPTELLHEANLPENPERISIVVLETTNNGHGKKIRRTIKISDSEEDELSLENMLLPYRDITNEVVFDKDGYPTFESLNDEAEKYLQELINENAQKT